MRALLVLVGIAALVLIVLMSLGFVNINQTQSVELPRVTVEGGKGPEFNADIGEIKYGTVNRTVEVPTVSVEKAEGSK